MSKNPNYTGNQTFSIPFDKDSLIYGMTTGAFDFNSAAGNFNAQNLSAVVANRNNKALENYIRPRNENNPAPRLPNFIIEPLTKFNLDTATPPLNQRRKVS
jgi:hypothetical protein